MVRTVDAGRLRPSALSYQITVHHHSSTIDIRAAFICCCSRRRRVIGAGDRSRPPGAKIVARVGCTTPAQVCEKIDRAISITYPLSRLERRAVASYTQWEIALGPAAKVGKAQIFASARESVVPRSK